ncbi:hypothetical protein NXH76_08170 [Blautia schinkii]|nr:hypothetical protein [Blautia schinkii]
MENRMLMIEALDEKALLEKRLREKIRNASFVDIVQHNGEIVWNNGVSRLRYCREAEYTYTQIISFIERYIRLTAAIAESNARTCIQTTYGTFTVSAALVLRSYLRDFSFYQDGTRDFGVQLYDCIETEYNHCLTVIGETNKVLHIAELVDPLDIRKRIDEFLEKRNRFLSELDMRIRISNATTYISLHTD